MNAGKVYFDFEFLKANYNLPPDALLKNISVNNDLGEVEITFYTQYENYESNTVNTTIRRELLHK